MSRRDNALKKAIAQAEVHAAGAEDPFAGIPPQLDRLMLYATSSSQKRGRSWEWDPREGDGSGSPPVYMHGDGYGSAHSGACSVSAPEPLAEVLIRMLSLDHKSASIVRDIQEHPRDGLRARSKRLRLAVMTIWDRRESMRYWCREIFDLDFGLIER